MNLSERIQALRDGKTLVVNGFGLYRLKNGRLLRGYTLNSIDSDCFKDANPFDWPLFDEYSDCRHANPFDWPLFDEYSDCRIVELETPAQKRIKELEAILEKAQAELAELKREVGK